LQKEKTKEKSKEKIWTVVDLITWAKDWLGEKGVESPRLNAELMLCHILNWQRLDLYTRFDHPLTQDELAKFKSWIKRRAGREPLQYILGEVDFLGLNLIVNPHVLIPRPETEMMAEKIIDYYSLNEPKNILDIGTGSGALALALANNFSLGEILGIDISPEAIEVAKENAKRNKINNIEFSVVNILDISEKNIIKQKYDLIVSNPPYVSSDDFEELEPELKNYEPKIALSDERDGLFFYKLFAEIFDSILAENGKFFLEIGISQENVIKELFENQNFNIKIHSDLFGINRFIEGKRA
jgi:release factor glutamine methyltransferase